MTREFTRGGLTFNLNDNRAGISKANRQLFPKYKLMCFDGDRWTVIGYADTKKEAIAYIDSMIKQGWL